AMEIVAYEENLKQYLKNAVEIDDDKTTTTNVQESTTTTISSTNSTTSNVPEIKTSQTNSSKTTTKSTTKNKTTTTTKKKTTTKKNTTTKVNSGGSVIPIPAEREVTYESTDYPNADDEGAWNIVDMINDERAKNGLKPVEVAVELRRLAEEAADFWYEYSDDEIKNYLYGHSNYRRKSNHLYTNSAYLSMYEATIKNTKVTTDKNLRYVGVGLIYRANGIGGLATHYYVIIYE
ncbi:MAG: hypothetical protein K2I70_00935, partial [Bacilli bacterium]|nr:hypothetical protein [Bacilli bacterium]